MPGYNGKPKAAQKEQPGLGMPRKQVPVNLSNGEFELPPEQVHAVGVQALDQMKNATHTPVAEQAGRMGVDGNPEMFFADGGAVFNPLTGVGEYWSQDNAQFEAGNPGLGDRALRAVNPMTGFGSALGAMHDAAGQGDAAGAGLAALQAVPVFGAMRAVAPAIKTAAGFVPSAGKTAAAMAGSTAAGVGIDEAQAQSFANGGLVDEEEKKRNSFDMTNTPLPGNPARAAQMQAQFDQPVRSTANPPPSQRQPKGIGLEELTQGLGLPVAAARDFANNIGTDIANVGRSMVDAEPLQRPGYPRTSALAGRFAAGVDKLADANASLAETVKPAAREALGARVDPAKAAAASGPPIAQTQRALTGERIQDMARRSMQQSPGQAPAVGAPEGSEPAASDFASPAGNGYTQAGNGVAVRVGASGTPEFSNDQTVLSRARAMLVDGMGGTPLKTPGVSNMADDVALEKRGSINNIGNGVGGGLSVGEEGDSAMAIARFERANQIRAEMNANRPRELGDAGGRVTVVRDSSRAPSIAEMVNERRERADASAGLDQRRVANDERRTDADIARNNQQTANDQLSQQKTRQEIEAGDMNLAQQRRAEDLSARIADPATDPAERESLLRTYSQLTGKKLDSGTIKLKRVGVDPATGAKTEEEYLADARTGRPLLDQGQLAASSQDQRVTGKVYRDTDGNRARFSGYDAQGNEQWETL